MSKSKSTLVSAVRRTVVGAGLLASAIGLSSGLGAGPALADDDWPNRPITMIVPWGAGGGTDTVARTLAAAMEQNLGQPVNVVNRTGGSGLIGHNAMASAKPDGYTIGTINVDLSQLVCKGLTDLSADKFTHIALLNAEAAAVSVGGESEFDSLEAALDAIRNEPAGTYTASGTGTGGIYHLAWAGLLVEAGIDPAKVAWVPSQGGGPSLKDVAAGAVTFVTPPLSTALPLVKAGKVKPLATMGAERFEKLPDVPTVKEAVGVDWTSQTWRMIGAPAGLSDDLRDKLVEAVRAAYDSETFTDFMNERGFSKTWMGPEEARAFHASEDTAICEVMKAAGLQ
ncbi:tripartite tricarboxylate transporter substrate binding protein [Marivibrio halodurans]|uniref:Tripartite tricarboxylate transporter substrate binding protein n=1 Tax=Marivibrio halodurans TaxID=2039722 RepID=A0A8J7V3S4_9PROT|nr:tripartite tricarboxylate transporter substrate binding protein [Marivibrio halodurans]MBP5858596.1 tripartite tricarboxylate transporter substrate binding protein [Marivibrio halodurans]